MKIAIIGAGIGGLTAAFDLIMKGHDVSIFERESQPGGLAGGFKHERWDWSVEKYYHHWFWTDHAIMDLINELGLSEQVIFKKPKTVVYHQGKFHPLDSALSVLKFPGFSLIDKFRFGAITAYLKYISGWKNLEKHTAVDWIKQYYGHDLYKIFFEPLLRGKFDQHFQDVNMAWMWARFKARSAKLGTYRGGFQFFLNDFTDILKEKGVEIHFNTTISSIQHEENNTLQLQAQGTTWRNFDQVLVTLPPHILNQIAPELPVDYFRETKKLKSTGAVVVIFSLENQLSKEGYYWYNLPKSADFPFLALVEHTNFVSDKHFNGDHIIYCGDYINHNHAYFSYSDQELADCYLSVFGKINPNFSKDWVKQYWVHKTPFAQPIPVVNHSNNILDITTPMDGVFLASMSQIYPWDRGTNYAVAFAHRAVAAMLETPRNA